LRTGYFLAIISMCGVFKKQFLVRSKQLSPAEALSLQSKERIGDLGKILFGYKRSGIT
jgi:hypothetical protein